MAFYIVPNSVACADSYTHTHTHTCYHAQYNVYAIRFQLEIATEKNKYILTKTIFPPPPISALIYFHIDKLKTYCV